MQIRLANTRGFCAGVDRAIEIVRKVLEQKGSPVYVKHEVVHNKTVVNELKSLGAIFVEEIEEVPAGETVIYSAMVCLRWFKRIQKTSILKFMMLLVL